MDELKVKVNFENPVQVQAVQIPGLPGRDGRDGTPGKDGENGHDGKSAYDIAVEHGFSGSEDEWLESLRGQNNGSAEPINLNFPNVYNKMIRQAVSVNSDSLEDILSALLQEMLPGGQYSSNYKRLSITEGTVVGIGDRVVHLEGQPKFWVSEHNGFKREQIPNNGHIDFTLSQPYDGNGYKLDLLYPTQEIADTLEIPAVVSEEDRVDQMYIDDSTGATPWKLWRNGLGNLVIEFENYDKLSTVMNFAVFSSMEKETKPVLLRPMNNSRGTFASDAVVALNALCSEAIVDKLDQWGRKDSIIPTQVVLPPKSNPVTMLLDFYASGKLVKNDLRTFTCYGQGMSITNGRLEYVEL